VRRALAAMDLPPGYTWAWRSGSHKGYGVLVRCAEAIPDSLAHLFPGGVLVGTPRDGYDFKQLELRYRGCQTVMPPSLHPSGNHYEWLHGEPGEAPSRVTFEQLLAGFLAIAELPTPKIDSQNDTSHKLSPSIHKISPGEAANDRQNGLDVIDRIKREICLLAEMERRGCTIVGRRGDMIDLSGMMGDPHDNAITYTLTPSTSGPGYIGKSKSTHGILNKIDYPRGFDVVTLLADLDHGGSKVALMKWFNPITRRNGKRHEDPPLLSPPEYLTRSAAERREKDRVRKNAARKAEAADLHARIRQQAEKNDLTPAYRAVVLAQLEWMVERNAIACNLGVRRIADLAHVSYGRTKQALIDLRALGYYQLTACAGGRPIDTAVRNFARGSLFTTQTILDAKNDPRIDLKHVCYTDSGSCERAPSSPAHENVYAASLDDWSWSADAHGADELSEREADHEICTLSPLGETTIAQQEAAQAPVVLDPCDLPPAWRLISDKRGMWSLRGPNGECEWLGCDENHARICWAVKNLQPGQSVHIRNDVLVSPLPPEPVEQLADLGDGYSGYAGGAAFNAAYVPSQEARQETPKAPVVIQLDPLVQAPPLSTDAAYTDFIWRWYAAQQTARSAAQRARFKREAESYLVDVSPEEATLRWEALRSPSRSISAYSQKVRMYAAPALSTSRVHPHRRAAAPRVETCGDLARSP